MVKLSLEQFLGLSREERELYASRGIRRGCGVGLGRRSRGSGGPSSVGSDAALGGAVEAGGA
jgi:hypothetical protein